MSFKNYVKRILPSPILIPLQKLHARIIDRRRLVYEKNLIEAQPELHRKALEKVNAKKGPIDIVFFALSDSAWKYDELYRRMEADDRFNPTILVCPIVNYGRENMLRRMNNCYDLFKQRGYNVIKSYDIETDKYIDVRSVLHPDVIFYTNPYEGFIDDRYYIEQFTDILTVYVSYAYPNSKKTYLNYDLLLHNIVWRRYVEHPCEVIDAKKVSRNHGINVIYSGYPGIDPLIKKGEVYTDVWKIKNRKIKRLIWAPHHTITDYVPVFYSTFLFYYDFMLEMAQKYKEHIQIAFKPHPLLRNRLELMWGRDKTIEYYKKWESLPNGMLCDSAYVDLFMTSDAMIHDSGSFIGEYLHTKKAAMYLSNGIPFNDQYNELAHKCLENYYIGRNKQDIEKFIINLIKGKDPLKEKREEFFKKELLPPNGKLASENILDDLIKELRPAKPQ